jgi:hypothetical protein
MIVFSTKKKVRIAESSNGRGGNRTPDGSYVRVLQTRTTHIADSSHSPIWVVEELNLSLPVKSRVHKTDLPTTQ